MTARWNRLGVYIGLVLLPGLLIGCMSIFLLDQLDTAQLEGSSLRTARLLSDELDAALGNMRPAARMLAAALGADGGVIGAHLQPLLQAMPDHVSVTVFGADGAVNFTTAGTSDTLSHDSVGPLLRRMRSDSPAVAGCLSAARPQAALVQALNTPAGQPAGVLVYHQAAASLFEALGRRQLLQGWIGAWLDQDGVVVARTQAAARFVGHPAMAQLRAAMQAGSEGMFVSNTLEGIPAFAGYSRSATSGCTVAVAIPKQLLHRALDAHVRLLGFQIVCLMLLTCLLAAAMMHYVLGALDRLRLSAVRAADGEPGTRAALEGPLEIMMVAHQFNLLQLAREQADAKLVLAASVFSTISDGILIVDTEHNIIDANRAFEIMSGYGRTELIGKNPRFLKSGKHDAAFYQGMWRSLSVRGHWHGQIWDRRMDGSLFAAQLSLSAVYGPGAILRHYIALFSDITEQRLRQDQIEQQAFLDPLTQLPNRRLLDDRLNQALAVATRNKQCLALCSIDLDGFKAINDNFGHDAGDGVLKVIAERLLRVVRVNDTVARVGGDEFVMVLVNLAEEQEAIAVLERALQAAKSEIILGNGQAVSVSASIGVAYFPRHGATAGELLSCSDGAMYDAKHAGRNCYRQASSGAEPA